jgi:hypothetical protein
VKLFSCHAVTEGRVANFLLSTSCIAGVWHSVTKGNFSIEVNTPTLSIADQIFPCSFGFLFYCWLYHLSSNTLTLLIDRNLFFFF